MKWRVLQSLCHIDFFFNLQTYEQQNWCRLLENDSNNEMANDITFFLVHEILNLNDTKTVNSELHMLKRFFFSRKIFKLENNKFHVVYMKMTGKF